MEPENIWQLYLQFTEMTNQFEKSSIALIQTGRELPERVHTAKYNVCLHSINVGIHPTLSFPIKAK